MFKKHNKFRTIGKAFKKQLFASFLIGGLIVSTIKPTMAESYDLTVACVPVLAIAGFVGLATIIGVGVALSPPTIIKNSSTIQLSPGAGDKYVINQGDSSPGYISQAPSGRPREFAYYTSSGEIYAYTMATSYPSDTKPNLLEVFDGSEKLIGSFSMKSFTHNHELYTRIRIFSPDGEEVATSSTTGSKETMIIIDKKIEPIAKLVLKDYAIEAELSKSIDPRLGAIIAYYRLRRLE